jgi:hypothetical protein
VKTFENGGGDVGTVGIARTRATARVGNEFIPSA